MAKVMEKYFWMDLITGGYVIAIVGIVFVTIDLLILIGICIMNDRERRRTMRFIVFVTTVSCLAWILVSILLILAVVLEIEFLTLPWLVVVGLTIIVNFVVLVISLFRLTTVLATVISLFCLALFIYSWLAVLSLYMELAGSDDDKNNSTTESSNSTTVAAGATGGATAGVTAAVTTAIAPTKAAAGKMLDWLKIEPNANDQLFI